MNIFKHIRRSFAIGLSVLLLASCGDNMEIFTPDPISGDINEFFKGDLLKTERFDISTSKLNVIVTNDKSLIVIQPNSIIDDQGRTVTGQVTVEVVKSENRGDLILAEVESIAYGRLLDNFFNFKVDILQEGRHLNVSEETPIEINIKSDVFLWNLSLVDLFKFDDQGSTFIDQDGNLEENELIYYGNWEYETENGLEIGSGYRTQVTQSGWYTIASYINRDNNIATEVCVELPEELFNGNNSVIYAVIGQTNTLLKLSYDGDNSYFCDIKHEIQQNERVKFITIASSGEKDNFFLGIEDEIIFEDARYRIVPKKQSLDQIILQLESI